MTSAIGSRRKIHVVPSPSCGSARMAGFTMVEMAVVVLVIGLVAAISMGAFSSAFGSRNARTADGIGNDIDGALLTYASKNNHLPCPDLNGNAREGDASGACPAGAEMGYVPYESLGLQAPATIARAVYGVYRNAGINADLVAPVAGTPNRADFQRALAAAAVVTPAANDHVFITGDNAAAGALDCAGNQMLHPAYVLVVPMLDRDGDGNTLDDIHAGLPASGRCVASPNFAPNATYDDHVAFTGFTTLLGLISTDSP